MRRALFAVLFLLPWWLSPFGATTLADDDSRLINQIMVKAHVNNVSGTGGGRGSGNTLDQRAIAGKATEAEKKQLLELYESLASAKPAKGNLEDWKKDAGALVEAAKAIVKGEEKAAERLKKGLDCKGCHAKYRPLR